MNECFLRLGVSPYSFSFKFLNYYKNIIFAVSSKFPKKKENTRKHIHNPPIKVKLGFGYFPVAFLCLHMYLSLFFFWVPTLNLLLLRPPPCNFQRENTKQETDFV